MEIASTSSCLCCGDASSDYLEHLMELHKFTLARARKVIGENNSGNTKPSGTNESEDIILHNIMGNSGSVVTEGGIPITLPDNTTGQSIHLNLIINGSDVSTEVVGAVAKVLKGEEAVISSPPDFPSQKGSVATNAPNLMPSNTSKRTSLNSHNFSRPNVPFVVMSPLSSNNAAATGRARIDTIPVENSKQDNCNKIVDEVGDKDKLVLLPILTNANKTKTDITTPCLKMSSEDQDEINNGKPVVVNQLKKNPKVHMLSRSTTQLNETSNSSSSLTTSATMKKSTIIISPLTGKSDDEITILDSDDDDANRDQIMTLSPLKVKKMADTINSSPTAATLKPQTENNKRKNVEHDKNYQEGGKKSKRTWIKHASPRHCDEMFKYDKVEELVKGEKVHRCRICSDEFPSIIQDIHNHVKEKHDINIVQYQALYFKKFGWGNVSNQYSHN